MRCGVRLLEGNDTQTYAHSRSVMGLRLYSARKRARGNRVKIVSGKGKCLFSLETGLCPSTNINLAQVLEDAWRIFDDNSELILRYADFCSPPPTPKDCHYIKSPLQANITDPAQFSPICMPHILVLYLYLDNTPCFFSRHGTTYAMWGTVA